jgi:arginine/lysine/ornithine decarboxylase
LLEAERPPASGPRMALTPRQAFFAQHATVALTEAAGRICAEPLVPYPPGVPLCVPGEVLEPAALERIRGWIAAGGRMQGIVGSVEHPQVRVVA